MGFGGQRQAPAALPPGRGLLILKESRKAPGPVSTGAEKSKSFGLAVSRRPPTAEARFRSWVSPCGICGGPHGTGTGFSSSTAIFPCQFHSPGAPLLGKGQNNDHLHHRVAQEASWLRCVRSVCCGALHH
jgi:hypothetical protein